MKHKLIMAVAIIVSFAGILMAQDFSFSFAGDNGLGDWKPTKNVETVPGKDGLGLNNKGSDAKIFKQIRLAPGKYQVTIEGNGITLVISKNWTKEGIIEKVEIPAGDKMAAKTVNINVEVEQNMIFSIFPSQRTESAVVKSLEVKNQQ